MSTKTKPRCVEILIPQRNRLCAYRCVRDAMVDGDRCERHSFDQACREIAELKRQRNNLREACRASLRIAEATKIDAANGYDGPAEAAADMECARLVAALADTEGTT